MSDFANGLGVNFAVILTLLYTLTEGMVSLRWQD